LIDFDYISLTDRGPCVINIRSLFISIAVMVCPVGGAKKFWLFGYNFLTGGPIGMGFDSLGNPYRVTSYDI
jgi:hypothetical protein